MVRTFAAIKIEPTKELVDLINFCQKRLCKLKVKWVEPYNLHITLRFFGNTSPEQISAIGEQLRTIAQRQPPFDFELYELGIFGSVALPKIIYAGVADNQPIHLLSEEIEQVARLLDFEPQTSSLTPHVTLGRPKGGDNEVPTRELIQLFKNKSIGKFHADSIYFFESVSTRTGPLYRPIEVISLKS